MIKISLPTLPLSISLDKYRDLIIEKARAQAVSHADVDRLLKQKDRTERQRVNRENNTI